MRERERVIAKSLAKEASGVATNRAVGVRAAAARKRSDALYAPNGQLQVFPESAWAPGKAELLLAEILQAGTQVFGSLSNSVVTSARRSHAAYGYFQSKTWLLEPEHEIPE